MRTLATFSSKAFNSSEQKPYFINAGCFGDDLCRWLISRLKVRGIRAAEAEPEQEDFGWYFRFTVPEGEHCCVVGHRPGADGEGAWILWIERERGLVGSIFGGRSRGIARSATVAIHAALSDPATVREIRWHEKPDFDGGHEELGTEAP